jgi:hypothetical protein
MARSVKLDRQQRVSDLGIDMVFNPRYINLYGYGEIQQPSCKQGV